MTEGLSTLFCYYRLPQRISGKSFDSPLQVLESLLVLAPIPTCTIFIGLVLLLLDTLWYLPLIIFDLLGRALSDRIASFEIPRELCRLSKM